MTTFEFWLLAVVLYNFLVLRLRVRRLEQLEDGAPALPDWTRWL